MTSQRAYTCISVELTVTMVFFKYNNNLFGLPQKNTSTRKSYISQKKKLW